MLAISRALDRIPVGLDHVAAAVGCGPDERARRRMGDAPSRGLLGLMVPTAEWSQVAFASAAAILVGNGVVEVAVFGRAAAAGVGARALPDLDQVP